MDPLCPRDIDADILVATASSYSIDPGKVVAALWETTENPARTTPERAARDARRRQEKRDDDLTRGPDFLTRKCVSCRREVQQPQDNTAPTFCTCQPSGPQMVPPPHHQQTEDHR